MGENDGLILRVDAHIQTQLEVVPVENAVRGWVVIVRTAMVADPEERHPLLPGEVLTRTKTVVTSMGG